MLISSSSLARHSRREWRARKERGSTAASSRLKVTIHQLKLVVFGKLLGLEEGAALGCFGVAVASLPLSDFGYNCLRFLAGCR
jgi:hypothetical protein